MAEDGTTRGRPINKNAVHRLLRSPLYVGKVRHNDDLFLFYLAQHLVPCWLPPPTGTEITTTPLVSMQPVSAGARCSAR